MVRRSKGTVLREAAAESERIAEQMVREQRRWREDPEYFVRGVLGVETLWRKQVEVLDAVRDHPRVAVASCHDAGKTFVASCVAWWRLLAFTPSKVITTAPSMRQVKDLLWSEIRTRHSGIEERLGAGSGIPAPSQLEWRGDADWFAVGFATRPDDAASHATKFVGYHSPHLTLILDEAGGIAKPIWDAAEGLLTTSGARALAIGNPTDPRSEFAKAFKSSAWRSISISAFEHPNMAAGAPENPAWGVSRQWVEGMRAKYGERSAAWYAKVLGLFPTVSDDTLISIGEVEEARRRHVVESKARRRPMIGVDVARYGSDETVLFVVEGGRILLCEVRQGQDTMATVGMVRAAASACGLEQQEAGRITIDDTGVGGGVTDRLREMGWSVRGENFGSGPVRDMSMANRRTELWWKLREWVRTEGSFEELDGEVYDRLMDDLTSPKYEQRSDGRIALEPKAHLKARIGRSPDLADALALTLAADWGGAARQAPGGGGAMEDEDRMAATPRTWRDVHRDWSVMGDRRSAW